MATYRTPGVYVEEIPKFPPSVADVPTAIPAFIGYTEKPIFDKDKDPVAVRISSLLEYENLFGFGPALSVNNKKEIVNKEFVLYDSMRLFYYNGGGICYIVSVGNYDAISGKKADDFTGGITKALAKVSEVTLLLFPDAATCLSDEGLKTVQQQALMHCSLRGDRFAILDVKNTGALRNDALAFRDNLTEGLDYGAAYYPYLQTMYSKTFDFESVLKKMEIPLENYKLRNPAKPVPPVRPIPEIPKPTEVVKPEEVEEPEDVEEPTEINVPIVVEEPEEIEKPLEVLKPNESLEPDENDFADYNDYLEALNEYEDYVKADKYYKDYLKAKEEYDDYVVALKEYDDYIVAVKEYEDYLEALKEYEDYLEAVKEYNIYLAAVNEYNRYLTALNNYNAYIKALEEYNTYQDQLAAYAADHKIWTEKGVALDLKIQAIIPTIEGYADMVKQMNAEVNTLPPSGAIAGIYAAVDNRRGVWTAPANVGVASVSKVATFITDKEQEDLNVDSEAGKSINAIRAFTGKGILVWGARTLLGNDNEWRYVSVRRFFNYVEESVKKSTAWAVFSPNDVNTWIKIKSQIENFLNTLWRQGALAGSKPESAYYVNVGLPLTMMPEDILEGRLIVEIGMAVVRPAEFIILRFSHKLQE